MENQYGRPNNLAWSVSQRIIGEVIPSLRALSCDWNEGWIILYFYHDGPITDEIEEHYTSIGTEIIADYPNASISEKIISSPYPQPLPSSTNWVYRRKEPFLDPS